LYEINTRAWVREAGGATLDDVPEAELDRVAGFGFDWIWLLGVWQTGRAALEYSRSLFGEATERDVCGSCFAITGYECHRALGGNPALIRMRERLACRGMKLMLDFVPNHTAPDHPWVEQHRDYYVRGNDRNGLAFGRDPNYPGWPDTLQLNYGNPSLQEAMTAELGRIAELCDGVRCDMAMLLLPDVFRRTWNIEAAPFWPGAIGETRIIRPDFLFLAEAYWDLEWTLQQQGFDYVYDKRLYDRLREGKAGPVRDHLCAGVEYQGRLARFLENHDEPRAAAVFPPAMHRAAALLTYCTPGMRFFHEGQLDGRTRRDSVHLCRREPEAADEDMGGFYRKLIRFCPQGEWQLPDIRAAWEGNPTHADLVACRWDDLLVIVNYSEHAGQGYVFVGVQGDFEAAEVSGSLRSPIAQGLLYVDLPSWGYHLFRIVKCRNLANKAT
jgi:glycosidase